MEWLTESLLENSFEALKKVVSIEKIHKGFSNEEKFLIQTDTNDVFLLRTAGIEEKATLFNHYSILKLVSTLNVPMTVPYDFKEWETVKKCGILLSYIVGVDGEECLKSLPEETQYQIGIDSGIYLKKLHALHAPSEVPDWYTRKKEKHERYEAAFREMPEYVDRFDFILKYISDNLFRITDRPNCFLHDDYHPGNLIIDECKFAGIIDFNRYEWGDPYHDFHKVALFSAEISPSFSRGQIHGYHSGDPNEEFWELYLLYASMAIVSALVWSKRVTPHLVEEMERRVDIILEHHQNINNPIPSWYRSQ